MSGVARRVIDDPARTTARACLLQLLSLLLTAAIFTSGCGRRPEPAGRTAASDNTEKASGQLPTDAESLPANLADFNRGAALMEQYRYSEAAKVFEKVVQSAPDWTAARYNLGLAYFNMHGQRKGIQWLHAARKELETVLAASPDHLHARFVLGLHQQQVGENERALECFEAVYRRDSEDLHAAYKYAEALIAVGRNEEGIKILEQVVERDPGFISAVYRLAGQYQRTRRREEAAPLFQRFKQLQAVELDGDSYTVRSTYGMAGKYYLVLGADNLPIKRGEESPARRVLFSPETKPLEVRSQPWRWAGGSVNLPGLAAADVDGDGDLDICLTALDEQGAASILLNDGKGLFSAAPPVADRGVAPCFGDIDNDGDVDLWLGRAGPDVALLNDGKGNFAPASFDGVAGPDTLTSVARLVDLDSDGDLDLLSFRLKKGATPAGEDSTAAASSVYSSNRDGSFRDVAEGLGLSLPQTPAAAVVYDDFDDDYDLDLIVFPASGPPVVWVNNRLGDYHIVQGPSVGLDVAGVVGAVSGDPDKDGHRDLLLFTSEGVRLMANDGRFRFRNSEEFAAQYAGVAATGGQFADMDNDGDLDIVVADAERRDGGRGPKLLINDWPRSRFLDAAEIDPGGLLGAVDTGGDASCVVADFNGDGKCDLLLAPMGKQPVLIENATQGGHWVQLDLKGLRPQDKKARSNSSGIGARVEVKAGAVFQQSLVGGCCGPVAMAPLRVHAGLGDNAKVDWLRILWPDAVLQAELEVAADRVVAIDELCRKPSSCPYLFAWDGTRFAFVSDFGGVGGLGYLLQPGAYARPDPTEYVLLAGLKPLDGDYVLQSVAQLEEVVYFDEAKLIAVDHPEDTAVYPNEMMAIGVAPPEFEVFCVRDKIEPLRAVDHQGHDVTQALQKADRHTAGAADPDSRFAGLANEHFVELDFGDRLAQLDPDSRKILFLYGWVEYGYSSTNYAASQAGLRARAPTLEVLRDGRWVEILREVGYPAGVNHMMTVDVTAHILPADRRIRISTNMELHWDHVFIAEHLADAPVSLTEAPSRSADLHFLGYPREYSPDGLHPNLCDYANVDRSAGWKLMSGSYTRFGEVRQLLDEADDCYAIMGRGEEITLRFAADAFGPVPAGRRRTFLLKTDSFCKDMDLYTAYPDTVEPLPFHGMSGYPYDPDEHYPDNEKTRRYRRTYNTRRVEVRDHSLED